MKWNKSLSVAVIAALALGASGCDDGLADINENPNAPTDVPAQYLLPQAIQSTVEQFYGQWFNLEFAGLFAQHWGKIQYTEEDRYLLRPAVVDGWWSALYAGSLKDWQLIIEKGQETGFVNHEATGRVMKAFTGHIMTDIWGDMPWSEALQGDSDEPITTPSYDSQESIYDSLVGELTTALGLFDAGARTFGPEDLIYGGDVSDWMKFANSLRLRLAMRMSDVDPSGAEALVADVLASSAGLIDENSENATLLFLESPPNQNPLFENAESRDDHAVSLTLTDYMQSVNDPRLAVYAEPAASDGAFRGIQNSTHSDDVNPLGTYSRIGDYWRDVSNVANAGRPALLLTAAEVHFLLAEAALNGWTTPMTAQQHYEQGVTLALQMYNGADGVTIDAADIADYLAEPGVAWGTTANGVESNYELVYEQKWLALYTNGPEAYAELRRTGYPDEVTIGPDAEYAFVPGRVPYPDVEQSLNADELAAARQAQGIAGTDGYQGRMWWDTTPQN